MTKMILLALLALAMATEASAQSRTFYDGAGRVVGKSTTDSQGSTTFYDASGRVTGPHLDQQQRHDHDLRCARPECWAVKHEPLRRDVVASSLHDQGVTN